MIGLRNSRGMPKSRMGLKHESLAPAPTQSWSGKLMPSMTTGARTIFARWSGITLTSWQVWTVFAITQGLMLLNVILGHHYGDPEFYRYAGDFAVGKLPYLTVPVEYPPLAMFFLLLPAVPLLPFAGIAPRPAAFTYPPHLDPIRYGAYGISFAIMMILFDIVALLIVMRFARRWTPGDPTGRWSGVVFALLLFASNAALQKFDLVAGVLCLAAILYLLEHQDGWAWAMLAFGTMVKGYPILLAPLFLVWRLPQLIADWRVLRRAFVGGAVASLASLGPVIIATGISPILHSILYHADRGTEIESLYGSVMLATAWIPALHTVSYFNPADLSRDITSSLEPALASLTMPILILGSLALYATLWWRLRKKPGRSLRREYIEQTGNIGPALYLLHAAAAVIMLFLLAFRALPAHYLLGIIPLAAVIRFPGRGQWIWLTLLVSAMIFGQVVVSFWSGLLILQAVPSLLMIVRNIIMVATFIVLLCVRILPYAHMEERP